LKLLFLYSFLLFLPSFSCSQSDLPVNSFESIYAKANPSLHYTYDTLNQIHNYSGNWDFDGDGINDDLFFVGSGGAHLYYYLRITLSSKHKQKDFRYLQIDFPVLPPESILAGVQQVLDEMTYFTVFQANSETGLPSICVRLDEQVFVSEKRQLKRAGLKSKLVSVRYRNGKLQSMDYLEKNKIRLN
jgi:hypothetical protein